jgi:Type II CAAX prenyl endopeptidase Rce1-like
MIEGRSKLNEINTKLQNLNRIAFILLLNIVLFIIAIGSRFIFGLIIENDIVWFDPPFKGESLLVIILFAVLFGPLLETYINQSLPYFLLSKVKYFKERRYLIIFISALFFGVLHLYSLFYIIYAFFLGLVFMYGYMLKVEVDKKAFYLIAISHSIFNLGMTIISL